MDATADDIEDLKAATAQLPRDRPCRRARRFGLVLPATLGNLLGGAGIFALLAHGQVRAIPR